MLHPAKRELRYQHEIVLWPREFVVEVGLEIFDRLAREPKRLRGVGLELRGLGFADVNMSGECITGGGNPTGREGVLLRGFDDVSTLATAQVSASGARVGELLRTARPRRRRRRC